MKEITSKEAASLLSVHPSRIRQLILENKIRSRKIGNTRVIVEADILKLKDRREAKKDKAA